jgi:hypothetical protein
MKKKTIVGVLLVSMVACLVMAAADGEFNSITLGDGVDTTQTVITFLKGYSDAIELEYRPELWDNRLNWKALIFKGGEIAGSGVVTIVGVDSSNIAVLASFSHTGATPGCVNYGYSGGSWNQNDSVNSDYSQMCHFGTDERDIFYYCHGQNDCVQWMVVNGNISGGTIDPDIDIKAPISFESGMILQTDRITSNTTLTGDHNQVFVDTDGGAVTITLPAGVDGTHYRIINTGSSGNDVTITPDGAELLIGANSNFTLYDAESLDMVYETTEGWW